MLDDEPQMTKASRIMRIVGWGIIGIAVAGAVLGLLHTWREISQPGLSAADMARIEANGVAEALYNALFVLPGALVLGVGWWMGRRKRRV